MDQSEYTTLVAAVRDLPDPRQRRGQRYPWWVLLTVMTAAVASGQRHGRAIGQWVSEHRAELAGVLAAAGGRTPSEATLRRALQTVDVAALDARLLAISQPAVEDGAELVGVALDGKAVRGVRAHGRTVHLLGLASHAGVVLAQSAVAAKANEISAAPGLLTRQQLTGRVVTVDALLTQRRLARHICRHGGHYLMVVKDNQPALLAAITTLFTDPPWLVGDQEREVWEDETSEKGHGRLEQRRLRASTTLNDYLDWPGLGQVLERTCRRVDLTTGEISEEVSYGVTSLRPDQASPAVLEGLWRGHWAIENRVHHVRDVSFGEDAIGAWRGNTAHALASLHNAILNLLRAAGWRRIADAIRYYAARVDRALALIGFQSP
jgi:predicted transposase YbfD/YdcC